MVYLGTMFAPVKDRGGAGKGFTHKLGDVVSISTPSLGTLANTVRLATEAAPWTYGASHLLRDLAKAGLLLTRCHPATAGALLAVNAGGEMDPGLRPGMMPGLVENEVLMAPAKENSP